MRGRRAQPGVLAAALLAASLPAATPAVAGADAAPDPAVFFCSGFEGPVEAAFRARPAEGAPAWEGGAVTLPQVPAASGARYEIEDLRMRTAERGWLRGRATFWTKGEQAIFLWLDRPPAECHVAPASAAGDARPSREPTER